MFEKLALYSRLFVLVCAAVMSFIMCSDAARASPVTTQADNGVKHLRVLRRLYTPISQHHQLFTSPLSFETGFQSGPSSETATAWNQRDASSIINHQSNPPWFTGGTFPNSPDNRHAHAGITRVQSRTRPVNQHGDGLQLGENYHPRTGDVYNSYPAIIRKSSHKEAASPFQQGSSLSKAWALKDAQKSYHEEKAPGNDYSNMAEVKNVWQPSHTPLSPSQTGRYSSTSLPSQRGHYGSVQSRKYLSSASQTAPQAPSIRKSVDTSVIKSNPSRETPTSSITDFSKVWQSASGTEIPRQKKVQSYLFKDSHASSGGLESFSTTQHEQRPSAAQHYSRFSSNVKQLQQSDRKDPTKEVHRVSENSNPLYQKAKVAKYGAQTDSSTTSQRTTAETPISALPVSGTDDTMGNFVPISDSDFHGTFGATSDKYVPSSLANRTTSGSVLLPKPGRTSKSVYGFRGFKNPTWRASKEPTVTSSSGSNEITNSRRYSLNKGNYKLANIYPSLSRKYNFGQRGREASTTTTTPAKLERQPIGNLDIIQTMSTSRPFTSRFKETRPLIPDSDAGVESKPDGSRFRIYRRIYGLKGFGSRPLEGAKALVTEQGKSARVQQGLEGFKLGGSQIWQPKSSRIQGSGYKETGGNEPGSNHGSSMSENEFKPLLKTSESTKSVNRSTPDGYKMNRKLYNFLGFQPVGNRLGNAVNKTHSNYKEQSPSQGISSAFLRSAGPLKVQPHPKSEPRTNTKPVSVKASLLSSSTSSTVRGKRVKGKQANEKKLNESTSLTYKARNPGIVRLPKQPARIKAVTYSDILGSASFSGVRATTQTPVTPADKGYIQNATATTTAGETNWTLNSEDAVYNKENSSKVPEGHTEDEVEEFRSVEENMVDARSKDKDLKTSDLFLDTEGSGSGGFEMFDVLSTKSNVLGEDLLELDYLRISAGNVSFKSMNVSHNDK